MESLIHKQIHEELIAAVNPVFISDERVDGDSLGAALALVDFMKIYGKHVKVYVSEPVPSQYKVLPHLDHCTNDVSVFDDDSIDLIVVFDCSDELYVKRLIDLIPGDPKIINIDHHKTNTRYGHINQVIVGAPATAQVIYNFYQTNNLLISRDAATCMLMGICFDTSAFTNSATDDASLEVASSLILHGARISDVIKSMFQNRSISALRVWGTALERLHHSEDFGCIITCLTRKDIEDNEVNDDEIDGLSNFLSLVTDTDTLYVLRETRSGHVKVSMRSSKIDVSAIAREHGGGGHAKAAGYTIADSVLVREESGAWRVEKSL